MSNEARYYLGFKLRERKRQAKNKGRTAQRKKQAKERKNYYNKRDKFLFMLQMPYINFSRISGKWFYPYWLCKLCGEPTTSSKCTKNHIKTEHPEWFYAYYITTRKRKRQQTPPPKVVMKKKPRIHLKPWKDPESLFCSPKLKEIIGKEPLSGEECKEEHRNI